MRKNTPDDIQIRIDIICASINKYEKFLRSSKESEEFLISVKEKLVREQKQLQWYKINHSEYFI